MNVIGLTGKAGAGKDTAAGFMVDFLVAHDRSAARLGLADVMKVSAARALGHRGSEIECIEWCNWLKSPDAELYVRTKNSDELGPGTVESKLVSGREFLQRYGTEAHRNLFGENFWVEALFDRVWKLQNQVEFIIVPDVRFENEAAAINDRYEGQVWEIRRPTQDAATTAAPHSSEAGIPSSEVRYVIENDGNIGDLNQKIAVAFETEFEGFDL